MNKAQAKQLNRALMKEFGQTNVIKAVQKFILNFVPNEKSSAAMKPTARQGSRELIKQSIHPARTGADTRTEFEKKNMVKIRTKGDSQRADAFKGNTPL